MLHKAGGVSCFGNLAAVQRPDGTTDTRRGLDRVAGTGGAVALFDRGCVLLAGGKLSCWSEHIAHPMRDGMPLTRPVAAVVTGVAPVVHVSTSRYYRCMVLATGAAECRGQGLRFALYP